MDPELRERLRGEVRGVADGVDVDVVDVLERGADGMPRPSPSSESEAKLLGVRPVAVTSPANSRPVGPPPTIEMRFRRSGLVEASQDEQANSRSNGFTALTPGAASSLPVAATLPTAVARPL